MGYINEDGLAHLLTKLSTPFSSIFDELYIIKNNFLDKRYGGRLSGDLTIGNECNLTVNGSTALSSLGVTNDTTIGGTLLVNSTLFANSSLRLNNKYQISFKYNDAHRSALYMNEHGDLLIGSGQITNSNSKETNVYGKSINFKCDSVAGGDLSAAPLIFKIDSTNGITSYKNITAASNTITGLTLEAGTGGIISGGNIVLKNKNILPETNNTCNLGSTGKRFGKGYFGTQLQTEQLIVGGTGATFQGDINAAGKTITATTFNGDLKGQWKNSVVSTNLNTIGSKHGWANGLPGAPATNLPFATAGTVVSFENSSATLQFFANYDKDDTRSLYYRKKYNGSWEPWTMLIDAVNISKYTVGGDVTGVDQVARDSAAQALAAAQSASTDASNAVSTANDALNTVNGKWTKNEDEIKVIKVNSAGSADALTVTSKGSSTQPIYWDANGKPVACTYSLNKDVPNDALFTDSSCTKDGHYIPAEDTDEVLSVDAISDKTAEWNTTSLVTGVNIQRDSKGHVTGLTLDSIKMPANPNTNDDTKNTTGTTEKTGTKLFLAGATSQAANPQTYSNSKCYIGTDNCLYSNESKVLTSAPEYSLPLAADGTRGGIQIGYTAVGANIPLQLASEKGYVTLTKDAIGTALGNSAFTTAGGTINGDINCKNIIPTGATGLYDIGALNQRFKDGYFSDKVYAVNGFYESSDERLKDFAESIPVDFEKLKALKKNYFTWKNDDIRHIGVSAQEIKEIYPEIVSETEDGTLQVSYEKLSVIALAAIDKLEDRISNLEEKLEILLNKI